MVILVKEKMLNLIQYLLLYTSVDIGLIMMNKEFVSKKFVFQDIGVCFLYKIIRPSFERVWK